MIACSCGIEHADAASLVKVGWQSLERGEYALLVNCTCRSTICAEIRRDARQCDVCRRLVVGDNADPKVCIEDETQGAIVLCAACFRRDARKDYWLAWERRAA